PTLRASPRPTLFPYTTLFRSARDHARQVLLLVECREHDQDFARRRAPFRQPALRAHPRNLSLTTCLSMSTELRIGLTLVGAELRDRKSTRLNSSHQIISYAVF